MRERVAPGVIVRGLSPLARSHRVASPHPHGREGGLSPLARSHPAPEGRGRQIGSLRAESGRSKKKGLSPLARSHQEIRYSGRRLLGSISARAESPRAFKATLEKGSISARAESPHPSAISYHEGVYLRSRGVTHVVALRHEEPRVYLRSRGVTTRFAFRVYLRSRGVTLSRAGIRVYLRSRGVTGVLSCPHLLQGLSPLARSHLLSMRGAGTHYLRSRGVT